jgi:DUF4097 and DUF4098 domain-containing protein YvlB
MTDHHFETHQPVQLYVELGSGQIRVTAEDTTASHVAVTGRDADRVVVELDGDRLNVIAPKDRTGFLSGDRKIELTITVPTDSALQAKSGSADVTARGRYADIHVRTGSGDVTVDTVGGQALAETGSGDIRISAVEQALRVKSGSGDVTVDRADGQVTISTGSGDVQIGTSNGPAVVKTGSGDLRVVDAQTDVALTTGSGDLAIGAAHRGRFTAKGASGDVHIGVPAGIPVWTDVSTISGRISSSLNGAGQPEEGADYVELRAKTVSGDIVLTEK